MKVANRRWCLPLPLVAFGLWSMLASPRALFGIEQASARCRGGGR